MKRVAITGLGAVSPIGNTLDEILKNLKEGYCGVDYLKNIDTSELNVKVGCECKDFNPLDFFTKKELRRLDRVNQFAIVSARKAFLDSGIKLEEYNTQRVGISFSSGIGGIETIEKESLIVAEKGFNKISPFFIPMVIANMSASHIAIDLGIHGNVTCPVTACAGSSNAILDGYRSIKDGYSDIVFAGGAEASLNRLGLSGFSSMRALNESNDINRSSIPFDKERSGFVMGEGAATIVLEDYNMAKKRGAKIYGEVIGAFMTCDAGHITAPNENGEFVSLAMEEAIKEAGIKKEDIAYINAHGTSTALNDKIETLAVKNTFKEHSKNLKMSSTKSMTGHLLGASGSLEVLMTLISMNDGFIPPTINYKNFDEECDLNIVPNISIREDYNIAMSNSLGFGGHNVSIIVRGNKDEI